MTSGLIPVAALAIVAAASSLILRRLPTRLRFTFDVMFLAAISAYFKAIETFPLFPTLGAKFDRHEVALRVVAGAWWLLSAHIAVDLLWFAVHREGRSREARLLFDLSAAAIYIATVMIVLNSVFAVPVTGVVATSGVVAIVIGLALQNTLADVFAGIAVGIEGPFRVGDRVQLGDKIEGDVVQVNWRSIRIQTDGNDVAIIPNSVVAKAEIVNRSYPNERRVVSVELPCPASAPPDRVVELLMNATLLCGDILSVPKAEASMVRLGLRQNLYRVTFHVASTQKASPTRDLLLRSARRQLDYSGLLKDTGGAERLMAQLSGAREAPRRLLRDLALFASLSDAQIDSLAMRLTERRLRANEALFVEGEQGDSLYLVAAGVVEFTRQRAEGCETLGRIGAGECVGEIGLLTAAAHEATATARTACLVYRLARDQLAPLLAESADLTASFDNSVQKDLEILHRALAPETMPDTDASGALLAQIRSMLHFRL